MKFEVYGNEENIKAVKLKLEEDGDGEVTLKVVDDDGDHVTNILTFCRDGTISMCHGVDSDLGFKLGSFGQVVVDNNTRF